jgi:hypothetical protein
MSTSDVVDEESNGEEDDQRSDGQAGEDDGVSAGSHFEVIAVGSCHGLDEAL